MSFNWLFFLLRTLLAVFRSLNVIKIKLIECKGIANWLGNFVRNCFCCYLDEIFLTTAQFEEESIDDISWILKISDFLPCWAFLLRGVATVGANSGNPRWCFAYDDAHCCWQFDDASFSHRDPGLGYRRTACFVVAVPLFESISNLHLLLVLICKSWRCFSLLKCNRWRNKSFTTFTWCHILSTKVTTKQNIEKQ